MTGYLYFSFLLSCFPLGLVGSVPMWWPLWRRSRISKCSTWRRYLTRTAAPACLNSGVFQEGGRSPQKTSLLLWLQNRQMPPGRGSPSSASWILKQSELLFNMLAHINIHCLYHSAGSRKYLMKTSISWRPAWLALRWKDVSAPSIPEQQPLWEKFNWGHFSLIRHCVQRGWDCGHRGNQMSIHSAQYEHQGGLSVHNHQKLFPHRRWDQQKCLPQGHTWTLCSSARAALNNRSRFLWVHRIHA